MSKVLLISLDAVSDNDFDRLSEYPNFKKYKENATMVRNVDSIFLSNTYPIHTSVMTGVMPFEHGVISNTQVEPYEKHPHWNYFTKSIKVKTLWQLAKEKGLTTAGVMWPVTAGAFDITYNVPEIMARDDEKQYMISLKNGSKLWQLKQVLSYNKKVTSKNKLELDRFSTFCTCNVLREKSPDFTFVHLIGYDDLHHHYGKNSNEMKQAMAVLDECLGKMMDAADKDTSIIIFSDHAQLDVHTSINPNELLKQHKCLKMNEDQTIYDYKAFFESCGGSSFFYNKELSKEEIQKIKLEVSTKEWFKRFLTEEEMMVSGFSEYEFGFCAKVGFHFQNITGEELGNHGYPIDYDNYKVFYGICGNNIVKNNTLYGGNLLNLTALVANELKIKAPQIKGKISSKIYKK